MKKFVILLICVCLLLCSCNAVNDDKDQTDKSTQVTDGFETDNSDNSTSDNSDQEIQYDCYNINKEDKVQLEAYISVNAKDAKLKLKVHTMAIMNYYNSQKEKIDEYGFDNFLLKNDNVYYLFDTSSDEDLCVRFMITKYNGPGDYVRSIVDRNIDPSPDWSVIYEYIEDPSKVFGDEIDVQYVYCIGAARELTQRDLFVYYVTDAGGYMLYKPYIYEYPEYSEDFRDDPDYREKHAVPVGYSENVYLLPMSVLQEVGEYIVQYAESAGIYEIGLSNYCAEGQIYRIVDIEPYKLVPGQLPE